MSTHEIVTNGTFSSGTTTGWTVTAGDASGYCFVSASASGGYTYGSCALYCKYNTSTSQGNIKISQTVNVTGCSTVYLYSKKTYGYSAPNTSRITIGGSTVYLWALTAYNQNSISVSGLSGNQTLEVYVSTTDTSAHRSLTVSNISGIATWSTPTINSITVNGGMSMITGTPDTEVTLAASVTAGVPSTTTYAWSISPDTGGAGSPSGNWWYKSGSSASSTSPVVVFHKSASTDCSKYSVSLTVSNDEGSSAPYTLSNIVMMYQSPISSFTGYPLSGPEDTIVDFTNNSTYCPTTHLWSISGTENVDWEWSTGTSASEEPSAKFLNAGTYSVSLAETNSAGNNTLNRVDYITIAAAPTPTSNFSGDPLTGTVPFDVDFTDSSTESPTSWAWTISGTESVDWQWKAGSAATDQNPTATFLTSGSRTVGLTATNGNGTGTTETKTDYITASDPPAPVAAFSGTPLSGATPLEVTFTDSSSGTPTSWEWKINNETTPSGSDWEWKAGSAYTDQNPIAIFNDPGQYDVYLKATNSYGYDEETKTDYITTSGNAPSADFHGVGEVGETVTIYVNQSVSFIDESTNSPNEWLWTFGDDGSTSTSQNPTHQYLSVGQFAVTLKATNAFGNDTETKSNYVKVNSTGTTATATISGTVYAPLEKSYNSSTGVTGPSLVSGATVTISGDGSCNSTSTASDGTYTLVSESPYETSSLSWTATITVTYTNMRSVSFQLTLTDGATETGQDAYVRDVFAYLG